MQDDGNLVLYASGGQAIWWCFLSLGADYLSRQAYPPSLTLACPHGKIRKERVIPGFAQEPAKAGNVVRLILGYPRHQRRPFGR
jgi:hypothetical protein